LYGKSIPEDAQFSVYDSPASPSRIYTQNEVLNAGDILPGFTLLLVDVSAS
jgi:hypothetical protein